MKIDDTYDTYETTGQLLTRIIEGPATVEDVWLLVIVRGENLRTLHHMKHVANQHGMPALRKLIRDFGRYEARRIAKTC
ncbi:hypothetical protein [Streptomyces xiamenensis]|uniref:hypothetical protein n=1 Tax=Streptomyces xiamenensis TaxID=408015 RepID=UPI0037CF78E4